MATTDTAKAKQDADKLPAPLLAVLGAGDLAAKAVADAFGKARERAEATRNVVEELPGEVAGLRERLDPAELRKLLDDYTSAALSLYGKLTEHGVDALVELRKQPQVKQLEETLEAAQARLGDAAGDARAAADDLLARITRQTRSVGEKTARAAEGFAEDLAEEIVETGGEVAHEVRSTSRRAANKTAPASKTPERSTTRKPAAKPTSAK
ncbi:hypothetical protein [Actinokineospora pegani]|uniref:hypothetical protein n=1 Tax=Actinokineospora pegani TaxID=2654637 RepID=UPI0012E9AF4F|nr:hypothetical protein [Actinokineospora pegani]